MKIIKKQNQINIGLQNLRLATRNKFLELRGKEFADKYHEIEKQISEESKNLEKRFREMKLEEGKKRAAQQAKYMKINKSALFSEAYSNFADIFKKSGYTVMKICGCMEPIEADYAHRGDEDEDITMLYPDGYEGNISVVGPYDDDLRQAGPEVRIQGVATLNFKGAIEREFVFGYTPDENYEGKLCIQPEVYLNGYWFMWPFNTGGCGPVVTSGSGTVKISLHIRIRQNGVMYENTSVDENGDVIPGYYVVNRTATVSMGDEEGAIYYIEELMRKLEMIVQLEPGNLATITISCKVEVDTQDVCLAIVDMGSGGFYFRVPKVEVSPHVSCPFPHPPILAAVAHRDVHLRVITPRFDTEE
ncbi:MAG: hypothetical protein ACXACX_02555 [Candidatus Hodarchaeales archaeon]